MLEFFQKLFSTDFAPHAFCLRLPGLIRLDVWSDIVIASSYALIPFSLLRLVGRRRDLVFPWMFSLFGLFILSCGLTHALGAWTLWHPIYRFDGLAKAFTALVSLPTAILLMGIVPRVLELPSPQQLRTEIVERKRAEEQLHGLNTDLEIRIEERTRELMRANELLIQSERRRLLAVEAGGIGTWLWNLESGEVFWDQNSKLIFGLTQQERITLDVFCKLVHSGDLARVEMVLNAARISGEVPDLEYRIVRPDGSERWVRSRGRMDASERGDETTIQGTSIDITEQKSMQLAMAGLASIVESSDDAIIGLDLHGNINTWNRSAARMFGYEADEVIGRSVSMLMTSARPEEEIEALLGRIGRGERIEHFETVNRHKNEGLIDISLRFSPIIDESGQMVGASEIARDITDRKRVDAALRNSEERLRMLAETVPDILFIADSEGVINFLSARFFAEEGPVQNGSDPQTAYLNSVHPEDAASFRELWNECVREHRVFQSEFRLRRRGGYRWVMTRALPIVDEQKAIVQWIGASTDIDQLKRTERALMQSNGELRQFAYAAAHDLQEPLRNVVNAAGMLSMTVGDDLDGVNRQYLQFCIEGAERMHGMIKDLLAFTTAVDGPTTGAAVAVTSEVMTDVEANLALSIRDSGATILYSDLPEVAVEPTHLLQLLQNIIGNAVKYRSPQRTPVIRIAATRRADRWRFEISDNGIGFSPEYSERIFGVFKRLHLRHEFPGSGIGLAICARIVAHYGGRIWAEGKPNQGAVFYFTLPVVESAQSMLAETGRLADAAG